MKHVTEAGNRRTHVVVVGPRADEIKMLYIVDH